MSGVKVHISSVDVRRAQNLIRDLLDRKVRYIAKDRNLQKTITTIWAERVTRFVPRSDKSIPENEHLQGNYHVEQGNVTWHRYNRNNQDIAEYIYNGGKGVFHVRGDGATDYGPHRPQAHWDGAIAPGTNEWSALMQEIKPYVQEAMKRA